MRRLREPKLHERQQAVTAGEQLRALAMLRQQRQGLVYGRRRGVVERGRIHGQLLLVVSARCIARHTLGGVNGISRWVTPNGASASITALAMAGVAAMVPASPTPFTPNGFTGDGVTVRSVSKLGSWSARGTQYSMSDALIGWPRSSYAAFSQSACPIPCVIPPCTIPSTIIGLMTLPTSSTAT